MEVLTSTINWKREMAPSVMPTIRCTKFCVSNLLVSRTQPLSIWEQYMPTDSISRSSILDIEMLFNWDWHHNKNTWNLEKFSVWRVIVMAWQVQFSMDSQKKLSKQQAVLTKQRAVITLLLWESTKTRIFKLVIRLLTWISIKRATSNFNHLMKNRGKLMTKPLRVLVSWMKCSNSY